ncbi:MAG: hypothetical protein K0R00_2622 [Herbinix sp.]|jgi:hypothetical protein|nr:hypothetical protein [Herbinix sp.]
MKKRLIGLLMILTMLISLVAVPDMAKAATSYLVLIETKAGKWTAYNDLAYTKGDYLIVKGYSISKALGLTYKNNDKTLTIQNGKKKLTLTKNSKSYEYYNGSSTSKKTAAYKTYAATIAKKSTYVLHYNVLGNLVYSSYFKGSNKTTYKGYSGVICYSTVGKITSLPNINNVVDTNGDKLSDTTTDNDDTDMVGYNGYVTIGNVKVPALTDFSDAYKDPTGHWGADVTGDTPLEDAIDDYSEQLKKDVAALGDEGNAGENSDIKVNDSVIIAQVNGDSMLSSLKLSKTDFGYEIYISSRLSKNPNKDEADYSVIAQNTLKLFTAIISSQSQTLFDSLYEDAEGTSFISRTSWTTIGDCQVKCIIGKGNVVYQIKAK